MDTGMGIKKLEARRKYVESQKPLTKEKLNSIMKDALDKQKAIQDAKKLQDYNNKVTLVKKKLYDFDIENCALTAAEKGESSFYFTLYMPSTYNNCMDFFCDNPTEADILKNLLEEYKLYLKEDKKMDIDVAFDCTFKCSIKFNI